MLTPSCSRSPLPGLTSTNQKNNNKHPRFQPQPQPHPLLQLLPPAITYLLQVALTKAKANLLATALTNGVDSDLLRIALTEAREDTLAAALTAAEPIFFL